jgi:DNA-binding protein HU-beta
VNKAELVSAVADKAGVSKADAEGVLEAFQAVVFETVKKGKDDITWTGFIKFEQVTRPARTGRNPATGATIKIPKTKAAKITAGAKLKAAAAGK